MISTRSGGDNPWGLVNVVGNAAELVEDGTVWHSMGGAHRDRLADCTLESEAPFSGADAAVGFRVLRELN